MQNSINICTSFDLNYWKYWTVMLNSLIVNADFNQIKKIEIYILTDFLDSETKKAIQNSLKRQWKEINIYFLEYKISFFKDKFKTLKLADYISPLTLYRLLIDHILPINIDRVLYLDSDMIVDANILEIYNITLDNNIIWACKEIYINLERYNHLDKKHILKIYFNAWLLLIDLNKWRQWDCTNKILNFVNLYWDKLWVADQDILNYIFSNETKLIHPQRNTPTTIYSANNNTNSQYNIDEFLETKNNPKIIHFFWSLKPWNWITHHPLCYKYYKYLKISWLSEKKDFLKYLLHKVILFILSLKTFRRFIRKIYLIKKWTIKDDPL